MRADITEDKRYLRGQGLRQRKDRWKELQSDISNSLLLREQLFYYSNPLIPSVGSAFSWPSENEFCRVRGKRLLQDHTLSSLSQVSKKILPMLGWVTQIKIKLTLLQFHFPLSMILNHLRIHGSSCSTADWELILL